MTISPGLYLLPNLLSPDAVDQHSCLGALQPLVLALDGLIAESEKGARQFLRRFGSLHSAPFNELPLALCNEHKGPDEIADLTAPLEKQEAWGLLSDAGLPIVADPGSDLVFLCRKKKIPIHPLPGPSSLFYALMLSGFPAQNFAFQGYLPRKEEALRKKLTLMERAAKKEGQTQLFIEAPYRTDKMIENALNCLEEKTYFAVFWNLTAPSEGGRVDRVSCWKKGPRPCLKKVPAVFLMSCHEIFSP